MKRSAALGFALLGALGGLPALAQQSGKTYVVGILIVALDNGVAAFRRKLADLGYEEGNNLKILYRSTTDYKQLPQLANDLVQARSTSSS